MEQLVDSDGGDDGIDGQTTTGLFIIESISKTNNNILLTDGQYQYYPTKKRGMPLVLLLSQTMLVMQAGQIGIHDEYLFTLAWPARDTDLVEGLQSYLNSKPGAQQDIIEAVEGSPSQCGPCGVIKMFWDTARLSVTEPGEAGGGRGTPGRVDICRWTDNLP